MRAFRGRGRCDGCEVSYSSGTPPEMGDAGADDAELRQDLNTLGMFHAFAL